MGPDQCGKFRRERYAAIMWGVAQEVRGSLACVGAHIRVGMLDTGTKNQSATGSSLLV